MAFKSLATLEAEAGRLFRLNFAETGLRLHSIRAPYRICPLGAHVDHQGGTVLGRTIDTGTALVFSITDRPGIRVVSGNYPARIELAGLEIPLAMPAWGSYVRGAYLALTRQFPLRRGIDAAVVGSLPGGGLSSSASAGLAYLHALAFANELNISVSDYVELDRVLENEYLGLQNGILDQAMICYSRKGMLLHLDTNKLIKTYIPAPAGAGQVCFLVIYSGISRALVSTGFNRRVEECREAAVRLGQASGRSAERLSDIPLSEFRAHLEELPPALRRRAMHYFGEAERVSAGRLAWESGDWETFGRLMTESGESSVQNYEAGSPALMCLQQVAAASRGVFGARFGGGGYGGCVIALVEAARSAEVQGRILERYCRQYPGPAAGVQFHVSGQAGGMEVR